MGRDPRDSSSDGADSAKRSPVSRRDFLKLTSAAGAAVGLPFGLTACTPEDDETRGTGGLNLKPDFTTVVLRETDFVYLVFGFVNFALDPARRNLVKVDPSKAAYIIVTHDPQHVLERSFREVEPPALPPDAPTAPPIPSRLAGTSRVVFRAPAGAVSITYGTQALLGIMARYEMSVALNATPPDPPPPVFFPRPILGSVSRVAFQPGPIFGTATALGSNALVVCTDDGRPPPISIGNAILAARNALGYRKAARATGFDFFPSTRAPVQVKPTRPVKPGTGETELELPFRLSISPNVHGQWAHATAPVASTDGRVELWHSRLGVRNVDSAGNVGPADESSTFYRTIRALWTRDAGFSPSNQFGVPALASSPFDASLSPRNRNDIVHQTSNFTLTAGDVGAPQLPYKPVPAQVNNLMLTALGGWMDVRDDFGDPTPNGLLLWEHRATFGRDHYVKVVYSGFLYPFGHRAVVVKVTERKFKHTSDDVNDNHPHTAYLRTRIFVVVKQPVMQYEAGRSSGSGIDNVLRKNPFSMIHVKTLVTPILDPTDTDGAPILDTAPHFWPTVGGKKFRFACDALDIEGNLVTFSTPAYFVRTPFMSMGMQNAELMNAFNKVQSDPDMRVPMKGQRMAFAPSTDGRPDDTTFETQSLRFEGAPITGSFYRYPFLPVVGDAECAVESVRQLAGAGSVPKFKYHASYVDHGFNGSNPGEVLFENISAALNVDFSKQADKSGGLVAPSLSIKGLSRKVGPVAGDLAMAAGGAFDPNFFKGLDAKLFGVIDLFDLLPSGAGQFLKQAPTFVTQALTTVENFIQLANSIMSAIENAKSSVEMTVKMQAKALSDAAEKVLNDITTLLTGTPVASLHADVDAFANALHDAAAAIPSWNIAGYTVGIRSAIVQQVDQLADLIHGAANFADVINDFAKGIEAARDLHVHLDWKPGVQNVPSGPDDHAIFKPNDPDNGFVLALDLRGKDLPGKPAGADVSCSLENFDLQLIAPVTFMILKFEKVGLSLQVGKKMDIDVRFTELVFAGPLSFVEELKKLIPFNGFSDPPSIEVSLEGIKAGFSLPIPSVAVGIFSLRNISLGAGFEVPFIGKPLTVSFNFCTRENPFELTVCMLGGGGFFGITLYPKGVYLMEAALEFGAALAVDFGVASGGVEIKAGIYFKMELGDITLTGYLRIRGNVDVLGLIGASIELYMDLTYQSAGNKVIGHASLEIEIHIFFLSIGVTISVEKQFSGSSDDPTFLDLFPTADPWGEYLDAFAA